jgi:CBS domain-containing protein
MLRGEVVMLCRDVMKGDISCVSPRDSAEDAAVRMRDDNVGFLPVCDQSMKVVGALTDRDLAIRLVAERRSFDTLVEDLMTAQVVSCRPDDHIRTAAELMARHHRSRIVCLDDTGRIAGVISFSDVPEHERDTARDVSGSETAPRLDQGRDLSSGYGAGI